MRRLTSGLRKPTKALFPEGESPHGDVELDYGAETSEGEATAEDPSTGMIKIVCE